MPIYPEQELLNHQINPTAMRLLVLEYLLKRPTAISLNDIEKGMHPADRITIDWLVLPRGVKGPPGSRHLNDSLLGQWRQWCSTMAGCRRCRGKTRRS